MDTDNIIRLKLPNVVSAPAPLLAVASQNKVVNADKKLFANDVNKLKPLSNALIIALAIAFPPLYIYFKLNIYIGLAIKK